MYVSIACIGSGAMGGALMKAAAKAVGGARIGVTDVDSAKASSLAAELGAVTFAGNAEAARSCQYLIIAVKPQMLPALLSELAPVVTELLKAGAAPTVLSLVAGASLSTLRAGLAGTAALADKLKLVRLMPNTPALIGQGMIALSPAPGVAETEIAEISAFLSRAGQVDRVDESYINAITALSGSGPAYVYVFIEALSDAGVYCGLSREAALRYAVATVQGAAALVSETGLHPAVLKDKVCSPAGTTIAAVAELERRGFRGTVIDAVAAAFNRAKAL